MSLEPKVDPVPQAIIQLQGIGLRYGNYTALHNIELSLNYGEITTIIGPNGAGKSSLVKVIAGLIQPSEGTVRRKSNLQMAYVPQKLFLDRSMPIKVSRFLSLARAPKEACKHALAQVGAERLWPKQMHALSGGELQRVLLARAIARSPDLLLLDEPLQGVDVNGQIELYRLISNIRDKLNCGIIMVSHDLHLVMAETDKVICLNQHVCCAGHAESISQHPEYLKLFGHHSANDIAVYAHNHDHHHNLHGDIEDCDPSCNHD